MTLYNANGYVIRTPIHCAFDEILEGSGAKALRQQMYDQFTHPAMEKLAAYRPDPILYDERGRMIFMKSGAKIGEKINVRPPARFAAAGGVEVRLPMRYKG